MSIDIRKLISEAFNEVYNEVFAEAAGDVATKGEEMYSKMKKYGSRSGINHSHRFNDEGKKVNYNQEDDRAFNYAIDKLVSDYKETRDPKIRETIQAALYPNRDSKILKTIARKWSSYSDDEISDAVSTAYQRWVLEPDKFDAFVDNHKQGTPLSSKVVGSLNRVLLDILSKGYEGGGSKNVSAVSMDTPVGDTDKTIGDKISDDADMDAIRNSFDGRDDIELYKKIKSIVIGWAKNNAKEKQYVALEGKLNGETNKQILEDNPELFKDVKDVTRTFGAFAKGKGQEISELISHAFGIDWNLADIDPNTLYQTYSADPEITGDITKRVRVGGEDSFVGKLPDSELEDKLSQLSPKQREQVMSISHGKDKERTEKERLELANNLLGLEAGALSENTNLINTLLERVLNRLK